jgi:hypothetical protein
MSSLEEVGIWREALDRAARVRPRLTVWPVNLDSAGRPQQEGCDGAGASESDLQAECVLGRGCLLRGDSDPSDQCSGKKQPVRAIFGG